MLNTHCRTCYNSLMLDNNQYSNSLKILISNLNRLMQNLTPKPSYETLASKLSIKPSTLRGWMSQQRTPTLKTIDNIANCLGCHTYQLLKPNGQLEDDGIFSNDSSTIFLQNLQTIFNEKKKFSIVEKCHLVNSDYTPDDKYITETMLISYLRTNRRRIPPLKTIDYIARALKVETYELLVPKNALGR